MAKLVVLTEGLAGSTFELKADKTTIGRLEDNSFRIPEQSVSSHHCEIFLRGSELVVRDLNSTNGTFVNGDRISETIIKPGQTLRLGQIEMRLEDGAGALASPSKKPLDQTRPMGGVRAKDLETGSRPVPFDKNSPFARKSNKIAMIFIAIGVALVVIIVISLFIAFNKMQ